MPTAIFRSSPPPPAVLRPNPTSQTFVNSQNSPHHLSLPTRPFAQTLTLALTAGRHLRRSPPAAAASSDEFSLPPPTSITAPCFVVGDNIDTDQIIPAEYLTLVPSDPDEYKKLGSLAFAGLPSDLYPVRFVEEDDDTTMYPIVIAGANFGCGSSREHAPLALGEAGAVFVVAESYARIFFRNSVATGEVYPLECEESGIWRECSTGDVVSVDILRCRLVNRTTGKEYRLKAIGDAGPVIEAGGISRYAKESGMIGDTSA